MLVFSTMVGNVFAYEKGIDDVTPSGAYSMVTPDGDVYILDVRTPEEWYWVGHPGPNGNGEGTALEGYVLNIAYKLYREGGKMILNDSFIKDVEEVLDKDMIIITMCRSGGRSVEALDALKAAGFTHVFNMVDVFEGAKEKPIGYRTLNGWKNEGLPYNYSAVGIYKD